MFYSWPERLFDWTMTYLVAPAVAVLTALLLIGGPIALVWYWYSPKFTLKKAEWVCTATQTYQSGYYQTIGSTTMWVPTTETRCAQYTRN